MEIQLLLSTKDLLEGELQTAHLQRDLLQQDFVVLSEEHEALKTAYNAVDYEQRHSHVSNTSGGGNSVSASTTIEIQGRLDSAYKEIAKLSCDLEEVRGRERAKDSQLMLALGLPAQLEDLSTRLATATESLANSQVCVWLCSAVLIKCCVDIAF